MHSNWPDIVNGCFELLGGVLCWFNVYRLQKDKQVKGVCWSVQAFFTSWSAWNLAFYGVLQMPLSLIGAILLGSGNGAWCVLALYYKRKQLK